jgi:hypothetical protein
VRVGYEVIVRQRLVIICKWKLQDLKEMAGGAFCGLERIGRRLGRAGIDSGEMGVSREWPVAGEFALSPVSESRPGAPGIPDLPRTTQMSSEDRYPKSNGSVRMSNKYVDFWLRVGKNGIHGCIQQQGDHRFE